MMTTGTPHQHHYLYDHQKYQIARLHDLTDQQNDLHEALDGLLWQQDQKKAQLAVAEEEFRRIKRQRDECILSITYDNSPSGRIRRNKVLAEASMTQLQMATIRKQIEYLERQIAGTRRKLIELREEIVKQRDALPPKGHTTQKS